MNDNSTGLGMLLGMTDTLHSTKSNLMKMVDVYSHASQLESTDQKGSKLVIEADLQRLFLKETRRILDSSIKQFTLDEIVKIYTFLPIFGQMEKEDLKEVTIGLKMEAIQFLAGKRQQTLSLSSINDFLNSFAIWEMTSSVEESKFLVSSIEKGLVTGTIRISETKQGLQDLQEFLSIYKREKMQTLGNPEIVELVTKEFLVQNFMKIQTSQLLELAKGVEILSLEREKRSHNSLIGNQTNDPETKDGMTAKDTEKIRQAYSELKSKVLKLAR